MTKSPYLVTYGWSVFALFMMLSGLVLLVGANHAAPGCTGPAVQRCDYVGTAKAAVGRSRPVQTDLGFEVYDQGSSVIVQQWTPPGEPSLNHADSVLIDKRSCRVCMIDWHYPTDRHPDNPSLGPLLMRTPAEDAAAADRRARYWKDGPGGISPL